MLNALSIVFSFLLFSLPIGSSIRLISKKEPHLSVWIFWGGIISAACYISLILGVQLTELHLDRELGQYDLDQDGMFSGSEITPEMKKAMRKVTSDTGRALAPITGLITCPLYSGFWHLTIGLPYIATRYVRKKKRSISG